LFLKGDNEMHSSTRYQKGLLFLGLLLAGRLGLAGGAWAIEMGDKAPDFKLPGTTGLDISLADFRGKKWVFLEFYGVAFVPT
jgi:hypothetical protein